MSIKLFFLFLGMAIVTYLPRMLPLVGLKRFTLSKKFLKWLSFVPAAVLASLLAPGLLIIDGQISVLNKFFIAALPTALFAFKTQNIFGTIVVGTLFMFMLNIFWTFV